MIAEHPLALSFLLRDDVYLLANDRATAVAAQPLSEISTAAEVVTAYQPVIEFAFTGGNQKQFLILTHYPAYDVMEPAHLAALENTLKRKDMSFDDVAIINISKYPSTASVALTGFFKPVKILLLGKNTLIDGLNALALNQPAQLGNSTVLYSFSFNEMMGNRENTKAFWEQMKLL